MPTAGVSQAMTPAPVRRVGSHDRVFYGSVAVSMALMAIVGFAPTYYLGLFRGGQWRPSVLVARSHHRSTSMAPCSRHGLRSLSCKPH